MMVAFWEPQEFSATHVYTPLSEELRLSIINICPVPLKVLTPFIWYHVKVVRDEAVKQVQDRVTDVPSTIRPEPLTIADVFTGGSEEKKERTTPLSGLSV